MPADQTGGALIATSQTPPLQLPALTAALALSLAIIEAARAARQAAPLWCDLEAASAHSGLSARTLRSMIAAGTLPALRDGRAWKIRRADLDDIRATSSQPTQQISKQAS
jgi:excisionase family DNA binding protein